MVGLHGATPLRPAWRTAECRGGARTYRSRNAIAVVKDLPILTATLQSQSLRVGSFAKASTPGGGPPQYFGLLLRHLRMQLGGSPSLVGRVTPWAAETYFQLSILWVSGPAARFPGAPHTGGYD